MIVGLFKLGSTRGLKGHQKIHTLSQRKLNEYDTSSPWYLQEGKEWISIQLEELTQTHVKIKGVDNVSAAQSLVNRILGLHESCLKKLEDGEVYVRNLIGKMVVNHEEHELGIIRDVLHSSSCDILVLSVNDREYFIPFIEDYVKQIMKDKVEVYWSLDEDWYN